MKTNPIKSIFLLWALGLLLALPLSATIEKVKLQVGSGGPTNVSNELYVESSNSNNTSNLNGFCWERVPSSLGTRGGRLPFRLGSSHLVTLTGAFLDMADKVQIVNASGTVVSTITSLTKTTVNGKGQLKFTVPSSVLGSVGNFEIRVRYFPELHGFDVLKCRVAKSGIVNFVKWVGPNIPVQTSISGGERSTLIRDVEYKLEFTNGNNNGTDFGTAVSLACVPVKARFLNITAVTVNSTGNTITVTMKPGATTNSSFSQAQTIAPNLQDFSTGNNFEFLGMSDFNDLGFDSSVPNVFGPYMAHIFSTTLSTSGNFTNLKEIVVTFPPPPPPMPNLVPLAPTSFGTTYKFGTLTVTDQQGKIYKNIVIPAAQDNNDLGTQLSSSFVIGNTSRCVSKELGNDPTLGVVTLHQITMGNYTCPITNQGNANATAAFTNTFRGNMVAAAAPVLPTQAALTRFTTFPTVTTVSQTLPSLNQSITNNNIVNKRMIQVFTFSNRPGAFYCDNAWPVEQGNTTNSLITITVDTNNNVNEGTEGENNNVYGN
jgi:hypothetical protein